MPNAEREVIYSKCGLMMYGMNRGLYLSNDNQNPLIKKLAIMHFTVNETYPNNVFESH